MGMHKTVRQNEILRLVRQRGSCSITELAEELDVSGETIRRNVKPLEAAGLALKVHGGIILPEQYQEPPIQKRMLQQERAKRRIAAALAGHLVNGDSLIIDTGSTTAYVAQALRDHKELTIVTNSSYIANLLASRNGNRVFMAGGELRAHDAAAFGTAAIEFVRQFEARYAVLSIGAMHATKGCMDYQLCEAEFSKTVMGQVETVIVAADSMKFDRTSSIKVCGLDQIDILVTDARPPTELEQSLKDADVRVLVAQPGETSGAPAPSEQ
jgi:DeoR family transcriptional regulator, glycerol-3-phosphate regulon repressor